MRLFRAAILTAKKVELDAVRCHIAGERRIDDTFDGTVYRLGKIRQSPRTEGVIDGWEVAALQTDRGQQAATYSTQILLQHFKPDIVLYVGVAGGDPSHPTLGVGDIVVGKVVRYYERASQYAENFIIKDVPSIPNRALLSAASYEADESSWRQRVLGRRTNANVFVEEVASGEKVQKSSASALWTAVKARYPDVVAVETEGHGFHYAVAQAAARGIMVRSISDMLDNKDNDATEHGTDDDRQALASDHAAAFAMNLIANLNTASLREDASTSTSRHTFIITISADDITGVLRATKLLADAINDPHLTVESLQPTNSFIARFSTTRHSAAYARAIFRGGFISELIGVGVQSLESDIERTDDPIFDRYIGAIATGDIAAIRLSQEAFVHGYPAWRSSAMALERTFRRVDLQETAEGRREIPAADFYGVFRKALKASGMTQRQLAERFQVDRTTVNKWATGKSVPTAKARQYLLQMLENDRVGRAVGRKKVGPSK